MDTQRPGDSPNEREPRVNVQEIAPESVNYMSDETVSALEVLPEECWPALVAASEELTGDADVGVACRVAVTKETLDNFDASRDQYWTERGCRYELTFDDRHARHYVEFQTRKGERRQQMIVVECGEWRACLL